MSSTMLPCTNLCQHFADDGPKYPNSGTCRVSTDPTDRRVFSSDKAMTFRCRQPLLRSVQDSLFGGMPS